MTLHTFAYYESAFPTTWKEMNVVADDVLTRTATTRFMIPLKMNNVYWAYAASPNLVSARLFTPSLETKKYLCRIFPHRRGGVTLDLNRMEVCIPRPPIKLAETEELSVYYHTDASSAVDNYTIITIGPDALPPVPSGEPFWVRATGSTTLTKGVWVTVRLTPEVQLEPGIYSVIKFIPISANCIAARLIIPGQVWRPGVIGLAGTEAAVLDFDPEYIQLFPETDYGRFSHLQIPEVQFLANAADTSEVVYMKLVKVS